MYQELPQYLQLLCRNKADMDPKLYDLLVALLNMQPVAELMGHSYWTSTVEGDPSTAVDLPKLTGREREGLCGLGSAAWRMLPSNAQQWLFERGVQEVSGVAVV